MEDLYKSGVVKTIGVSNFMLPQMKHWKMQKWFLL